MRREYKSDSGGSGPSPSGMPFEDDLIFYAPLTEGDFTDHISGVTGTFSNSYITATWDNDVGMYKFNLASGTSTRGLVFDLPSANAFTKSCTMFVTFKINNFTNQNTYLFNATNTNYANNYPLSRGYFGSYADSSTPVIGCAVFSSSGDVTYYISNCQSYVVRTASWTSYPTFNKLTIADNYNNYGTFSAYISDCRVYGRELSVSEIEYVFDHPYTPVQLPPTTPTNVSANKVSANVVVTWTASSRATGYKIYRCSTASGTYTQIGTVVGTTYTDSSPYSSDNYYKIKATNDSGDSNFSSYAYCDYSVTVPGVPQNLTATAGSSNVALSWNAVTGATSYDVYRCDTASGTYTQLATGITTNSYTDSSPLTGANYYKVRGVNSVGNGEFSSYATASYTPPDIPFASNLVFYAPLTQGDLSDHISGVTPTTSSGCSVEWDSSKSMYLLTATGSFLSALRYRGLSMGMADRQGCTIVIDCQTNSQGSSNYSAVMSTPEVSRNQTYNVLHIHRQRNGDSSSGVRRLAATMQSSSNGTRFYIYYYNNGTLNASPQFGASVQFSYNEVDIGETHSGGGTFKIWVKNARVYNRYMSASEIAQL